MYGNCGEISNFSTGEEISDVFTWQMWRNLIWHVCDVENVAIYAKFMQFCTRFHVEKNWVQKYICREKNDKYEVCLCSEWQVGVFFWV